MKTELAFSPQQIIYQVKREDLIEFGKTIAVGLWSSMTESVQKKAEKYYTRQECATILRCSLVTFHAMVNREMIPTVKVGRKTLVPAEDFDRLVASGELAKYKHSIKK